MKKFQPQLNIANFICKFDDLVLLDLAEQIVLPAFLDSTLKRTYADTTKYFILDAAILDVPNEFTSKTELAVVGRFVKEGQVSRDQVLRGREIVKDRRVLESAPSSIFVLFLSNHKLLFVKEVAGAPSLENFGSTIENFIRYKRKEFIDNEFLRLKETAEPITKKDLFDKYPSPSVAVVPLASEATMTEFISKFAILKSVEVKLLDTNHELDNSELFADLRKAKDLLSSDVLTVRNESKGQLGLNKKAAAKLVAIPAEEGNSRIKLSGTDAQGDTLVGNDEKYRLSIPITLKRAGGSTKPNATIGKMIDTYLNALQQKILTVQKGNAAAIRKLTALKKSLHL